jgi:hypothetical protein
LNSTGLLKLLSSNSKNDKAKLIKELN